MPRKKTLEDYMENAGPNQGTPPDGTAPTPSPSPEVTVSAEPKAKKPRKSPVKADPLAAKKRLVEIMGISEIEERLTENLMSLVQAHFAATKTQNDCRVALSGIRVDEQEAIIIAEVETQFEVMAEERKSMKLPNNATIRKAEVSRRLAHNKDYQEAVQEQNDAKDRMANAAVSLVTAELMFKATKALLDSRIAQLNLLAS